MACKIELKETLLNSIQSQVLTMEAANFQLARKMANDINKQWGFKVVSVSEGDNDYTNKVTVNIPKELLQKYHEYFEKKEREEEARGIQRDDASRAGEEYDDDYLFQAAETQSTIPSDDTISKVKKVLDSMGVKIRPIVEFLRRNPEIDESSVNAVTNIARGLIYLAEGKEDVTITEEMVHVATSILEQTNPKLITEMISQIGKFKIYKDTFDVYKDYPAYQTKDGKPDIRKIKKEAVDKLIADLIVNESTEFELADEGTRSMVRNWWQRILDFIKGLYTKSSIKLYKEAADIIMSGNLKLNPNLEDDGLYFQVSDKQKDIQQRLIATYRNVRKVKKDKEALDPLLVDNDEADNWYETINDKGEWERIKKRVTDRVKAWYQIRFKDKEFSKEEKIFNEFKRELGVKGHEFLEEIHHRFFYSDPLDTVNYGTLRPIPLPRVSKLDDIDESMSLRLEKYFIQLIDAYTKDGIAPTMFSEAIVYDPVEKEAGTIDLLIVDAEGTSHILDWKFMSIAKEANDIPWYKQGAYNIQLGRYKDILQKRYGVSKIGHNRAIPILFDFEKDKTTETGLRLKGLSIGSVDASKIEDLKLAPVPEQTETTGNANLDELIEKMNAMLAQIGKIKASTDEEREYKRERMNVLSKAIRQIRVTLDLDPIIDTINIMAREGERIINQWESTYKNRKHDDPNITDKMLSEFAFDLLEYMQVASVFKETEVLVGNMVYDPKADYSDFTEEEIEERKQVLTDIRDQAALISKSLRDVIKISNQFGDKYIGLRNLVSGLLNPEVIVKGLLGSLFKGVSDIELVSTRILFRMINEAKHNAQAKATERIDIMLAIRKKLQDKGTDLRKVVSLLYQKNDKNKSINKLVYKYKKEFYDGINDNALEGNRSKQWLEQNIDMEAYKAEAGEMLKSRMERINAIYVDNIRLRDDLLLQESRKWDITRSDFNGFGNYILKRHPLAKWESEEYKRIKADSDLLDLYNFIQSINDDAVEVGYISNVVHHTFLPFVRKSFAERLSWDGSISEVANFAKGLQARVDDVGYGQINALTGEYEYAIPKYYTHDFSLTESGERDYSEVSEDLFKNMVLYISHLENYKYMSDVEGQLLLLRNIEEHKGHLATNKAGQAMIVGAKTDTLAGNKENTETYDLFLRALLYEHKYPSTDSDTVLNTNRAFRFIKQNINKMMGKEVMDENDDSTTGISMIKSIETVNRMMQLKTLGYEIFSGGANFFGANIQVITQAGNYFTASEFLKNEADIFDMLKSEEEKSMWDQLLDIFMPLKESPVYERLKKAGMTTSTRMHITDHIMMFMRVPELHLERKVFQTLIQNMMVVDGKIVSIPEFVKAKYKNRYKTPEHFRRAKPSMKEEIKELKRTKSIDATRKLENGKLVIPGLDLTNRKEIERLTSLSRRISRNATGGIADNNESKAMLNIWTKSMLVFKGWIPKLIDTRFGKFEKVSDDFSIVVTDEGMTEGEKFDIGRARLWFYVMGTSIRDRSLNVRNLLIMNEEGIKMADELFEKYGREYEMRTGQPMTMSKEEFIDMIRNNLRNQTRELALLLALVALHFSMGLVGPDEEDDKATRNFYRLSQRTIDKFVQELSFFYNPVEFQGLLSGSMFPAMGLISDIMKFTDHLMMEVTGFDISNPNLTYDEVVEKAHPMKYAAKLFPGTKAAMTYGPAISSDFADYFDITLSNRTRR